jgi:type I restriction enzyme M protein
MPNSATQPTTAQSLGALLKSARDIMRKDKGLNGDLDRLPILTWIMLLKFLNDLGIQREVEVKLAGTKFKPAIEPPHRWRDWAAQSDGITGDELLPFINNGERRRARWCWCPEHFPQEALGSSRVRFSMCPGRSVWRTS